MTKARSNQFQEESEILGEFQAVDAELARQLLSLRQTPSALLQHRIQSIPQSSDRQPSRRTLRPLLAWVVAGVVFVMALLAIFPGLRTAAAQVIQQIFGAGISFSGPGGFATFKPSPPFQVKQPGYLPEGFELIVQRYQPVPDPQTGQASPGIAGAVYVMPESQSAEILAQRLEERDSGDEPHILLGYGARDGQYLLLFERASQSDEELPPGDPRTVGNWAASLQRSGQTLKLTWIDEGTWMELEGTLSENEMLKVAEGLITAPTPTVSADYFSMPPFCNPNDRPPDRFILGEVSSQQFKGSVEISLMTYKVLGEYGNVAYGSDVMDVRGEVLEPALAALQNPAVPMQRLSYLSLNTFSRSDSDSGPCLKPSPDVQGYVVVEVWDNQINVGFGGAGAELKALAIKALEREIQNIR